MNPRERRRSLIKRIIVEHRIGSQDELVRLLAMHGVQCTQATLSRDLRDMNVVRRNTAHGQVYMADRSPAYLEAFRRVVGMEILNVRHNGVMVVIRTLAGRAEGVAAFLDTWGHANILGTVAGDDTVFVAPIDTTKTLDLVRDIQGLEIPTP
jgi:transcriptional regulator of arginine metabolism